MVLGHFQRPGGDETARDASEGIMERHACSTGCTGPLCFFLCVQSELIHFFEGINELICVMGLKSILFSIIQII